MIKCLKKYDKVAIVSLSSGILGENFAKHELELGIKRLKEFELEPVFMPNSLKGLEFISTHPKERIDDLIEAFENKEIKAIICAIGGVDGHKTLPYIFESDRLKTAIKNNPKIFLGFSDITNHHFALHKLGISTFYGQSFLTDLAEFENDMLAYSKKHFLSLFDNAQNYEIEPSDFWFEERTDFSANGVGTERISHPNHGYEFLGSNKSATGKLLGGCLDVIADMIGEFVDEDESNAEKRKIYTKYNVFPSQDEWAGRIMFIETCETKITAEIFRNILTKLKQLKVFDVISGLIVGKPADNVFYDEYKQVVKDFFKDYNFPILFNAQIGHCYPHTIFPIDALAEINPSEKKLKILKSTLGN